MSYLDERRLARGEGWTSRDWQEECRLAGAKVDELRHLSLNSADLIANLAHEVAQLRAELAEAKLYCAGLEECSDKWQLEEAQRWFTARAQSGAPERKGQT